MRTHIWTAEDQVSDFLASDTSAPGPDRTDWTSIGDLYERYMLRCARNGLSFWQLSLSRFERCLRHAEIGSRGRGAGRKYALVLSSTPEGSGADATVTSTFPSATPITGILPAPLELAQDGAAPPKRPHHFHDRPPPPTENLAAFLREATTPATFDRPRQSGWDRFGRKVSPESNPHDWTKFSVLFSTFLTWCAEKGRTRTPTAAGFRHSLRMLAVHPERTSEGNFYPVRFLEGVTVAPTPPRKKRGKAKKPRPRLLHNTAERKWQLENTPGVQPIENIGRPLLPQEWPEESRSRKTRGVQPVAPIAPPSPLPVPLRPLPQAVPPDGSFGESLTAELDRQEAARAALEGPPEGQARLFPFQRRANSHVRAGNCWAPPTRTSACHKHDQPRGNCDRCPRCPRCERERVALREG